MSGQVSIGFRIAVCCCCAGTLAGTILCAAPALAQAAGGTAPPAQKTIVIPSRVFTGKVAAVIDGQTLRVRRDNTDYAVRLYGVDAPSGSHREAAKARAFLEEMKGQDVRVEERLRGAKGVVVADVFLLPTPQERQAVSAPPPLPPYDPSGTRPDMPLGRRLPQRSLHGISVNRSIIDAGQAAYYPPHLRDDPERRGEFQKAQRTAREAGRGIWSARTAKK